jgi:hypothetical protein
MDIKNICDNLQLIDNCIHHLRHIIDCAYKHFPTLSINYLKTVNDSECIERKSFAHMLIHYLYDVCSNLFNELEWFKNNTLSFYKSKEDFVPILRPLDNSVYSDMYLQCPKKLSKSNLRKEFFNYTDSINAAYTDCRKEIKDLLKHLNQYGLNYSMIMTPRNVFELYDENKRKTAVNEFYDNKSLCNLKYFIYCHFLKKNYDKNNYQLFRNRVNNKHKSEILEQFDNEITNPFYKNYMELEKFKEMYTERCENYCRCFKQFMTDPEKFTLYGIAIDFQYSIRPQVSFIIIIIFDITT